MLTAVKILSRARKFCPISYLSLHVQYTNVLGKHTAQIIMFLFKNKCIMKKKTKIQIIVSLIKAYVIF